MPDWNSIADEIAATTGQPFNLERQHSIGGGCINSAFCMEGGGEKYFIKLNQADKLDMFQAESDGLQELQKAEAIRVPKPICSGVSQSQSYIVMEYIPSGGGKKNVMQAFGQQFVNLHRCTQENFGWVRNNTIGATTQINDPCEDWLEFWRKHRLGFQLDLAAHNRASSGLLRKGEQLLSDMESFFSGYAPTPSLLHGDLWSGNYSISDAGEPVIFDPAVYFGDREADLAMTELFGGFSADFYAAYNDAWPIDPGYKVRKTFYNLYHIINHFNMFGGGYGSQAEGMLDHLLSELR